MHFLFCALKGAIIKSGKVRIEWYAVKIASTVVFPVIMYLVARYDITHLLVR
jgi:hypothetical protein